MKFSIIIVLSCFTFVCGIVVGKYNNPINQFISKIKKVAKQETSKVVKKETSQKNKLLNKFNKCNIPKTSSLNGDPHIFVGHAYGSPSVSTFKSFLAPDIENFIEKNSSKFNSLIFTGDVFFVPSKEKWNKLRTIAGMNMKIFVAPGNHDVERPDSNEIFKMTEFGKKNYPILTKIDDTPLVIENSVQSNWNVSDITIDLINKIDDQTIIIARHNAPTKDLLTLVNSRSGMSESLRSVEEISQVFDSKKKYYWIIGDSGANKNLPRLSCLVFENHIFLLNGLGQIVDDSIILYRNQNFFEYVLD